jgi:hypothetical protein
VVGCVAPLGPGYTVEQQRIDVEFAANPEPAIHISANYGLRNTGNRKLNVLEMRLPGGRRVNPQGLQLKWDGSDVATEPSYWNPRNSVITFAKPWAVGERHTLQISFQLRKPKPDSPELSFAEDGFFLPAATWAPELPQARGLFGFGGTPPKTWELVVQVPQDFLVHMSGRLVKATRRAGVQTVVATQTPSDHYPLVVAGRYVDSEIGSGQQKVHVWTRLAQPPILLKETSEHIATVTQAYDATFGARAKTQTDFWAVECPAIPGCFSNFNPVTAKLLGDAEGTPQMSEMESSDTLLFNVNVGTERLAATAGPGLAASWLGYGQNPGFYDQVPPLSQLPTFAAAVGREALQGSEYRTAAIRRALQLVPRRDPPASTVAKRPPAESDEVIRAKSFLFFYGLQDHFGQEAFRRAITEMLYARRARGFDIADLIAAFDDETHQNAAEFVRIWMKRPGVPNDFRARYESSAARASGAETTPAEQP